MHQLLTAEERIQRVFDFSGIKYQFGENVPLPTLNIDMCILILFH